MNPVNELPISSPSLNLSVEWRRSLLMMHPDCPFSEEVVARFWSHVIVLPNGCWIWIGSISGDYGRVGIGGKVMTTHRVAYKITRGHASFPCICHDCPDGDNGLCCNPMHLWGGTHKENSEDMARKGRGRPPRGERCHLSVLTLSAVSQIKRHILNGTMNQCEIARVYNCSKSAINAIRTGDSWANVNPQIPSQIPQPHRKLSDSDYLDIRQAWRDGWTLKSLAEQYSTRVDNIQAILKGKRGTAVPIGERPNRQHAFKISIELQKQAYQRRLSGEREIDLAKEFGVSRSAMNLMFHRVKELV